MNVRLIHIAQQGEEMAYREAERKASELLQRISVDPAHLLSKEWQVDKADRSVLGHAAMQLMMGRTCARPFDLGSGGWVDDNLADLVKPWGFELSEIKVPVEIRVRANDVLVPSAHGARLAANVPGARAVVIQDAGHF